MEQQRPLPNPNADTRTFWEGCRTHQLRFQRCGQCGHVRWPPSVLCSRCHSLAHEWILACGRGKVYTYAVYHQAFHPAFQKELPYAVAVIELEEGPRILSNIVGCDHRQVRCGMDVEVVWEERTEGFRIPRFTPIPRLRT
jgi:uncharacterized OB-fold protein